MFRKISLFFTILLFGFSTFTFGQVIKRFKNNLHKLKYSKIESTVVLPPVNNDFILNFKYSKEIKEILLEKNGKLVFMHQDHQGFIIHTGLRSIGYRKGYSRKLKHYKFIAVNYNFDQQPKEILLSGTKLIIDYNSDKQIDKISWEKQSAPFQKQSALFKYNYKGQLENIIYSSDYGNQKKISLKYDYKGTLNKIICPGDPGDIYNKEKSVFVKYDHYQMPKTLLSFEIEDDVYYSLTFP